MYKLLYDFSVVYTKWKDKYYRLKMPKFYKAKFFVIYNE